MVGFVFNEEIKLLVLYSNNRLIDVEATFGSQKCS